MKITLIFDKILDLILKKTKSGEKEQELQIRKQESFNKLIILITLIFIVICGLNELFPVLEISPWWYDKTEKVLTYILGGD
ncbi:MAG: hypothetical protein ACRCY7_07855 [Cetobacterium sp.]|uniref:hypothetical protein n=1 Tax=Cetobacterium sp. TaxID=2071632 RepID=UPI003F3FC87B